MNRCRKIFKLHRKMWQDNHGSGLLMVLIMVGFLSILAAVLMFVAYGGYQMRINDRQNKDNFYTVETVLDEINVGLQTEVSKALTKAYKDVMLNYSLYETPAKRSEQLYNIYYAELQKSLQLDDTHTTVYDIEKLRGYLSAEVLGDGTPAAAADGSRENFGTYGAIVESTLAPNDVYTLSLKSDGIVLKDLKVTYVNPSGYVAIITTDIKIALPRVNFAQSSAFPDLNKYCLIADEGLRAGNTFVDGSITIGGGAYARFMQFGVQPEETGITNFLAGSSITFDPSLGSTGAHGEEIQNNLLVSKEDIRLDGEGTSLSTVSMDLWAQNILLNSSSVSLDGNTYVRNDLRIDGIGCEVSLSGTYSGFGVSTEEPDNSSAIVVNGRQSSLDLSNLKGLNISGHTYIATTGETNVDGVKDEDDADKDILMGESIAVKSSQLIYLVPPEALGCKILSNGTVGESMYRSNPMKLSQYQEIKNHPEKYVLLDAERQILALNNKSLKTYMNQQTLSGGGSEYRPMVLVKQTNTEEALVYCFMQFKNEQAANQYFRDYYGVNAETVDKYTKIYADAIKMPEDTDNLLYLHLAGNVLTYEETGDADIIKATDGIHKKKQSEEISGIRNETYQALTTKMVTNLSQLTMTEQSRTVFHNIIDKDAMEEVIQKLRPIPTDNKLILATEDDAKAVVLCLETEEYVIDTSTPANVKMVISLGNVRVKKDFEGLILAAGEIIVDDEKDFDHKVVLKPLSVQDFSELLMIKRTKGIDDYYALVP